MQGVGPKTIEKIEAAGITSIEKLADMTPEQLIEIPGIGEKMVEKIQQSVAAYFESLEAQAVAPDRAFNRRRSGGGERGTRSPRRADRSAETAEATEVSATEATEAAPDEAVASAEVTPEAEETTPEDKAAQQRNRGRQRGKERKARNNVEISKDRGE